MVSQSVPSLFQPFDHVNGRATRQIQWKYILPVLAAPFVHIVVSSLRHAKTPAMKKAMILGGVVGGSVSTVVTRLVLMSDAGYPGKEDDNCVKVARLESHSNSTQF
eukprot:GFYU01003837.1.p1 GENE.GFYU01003837.1~~GFYU01003837.1.p1  ORF type:complete len:106 (+),score=19.93 GFYU01003837.1:578-895(+)